MASAHSAQNRSASTLSNDCGTSGQLTWPQTAARLAWNARGIPRAEAALPRSGAAVRLLPDDPVVDGAAPDVLRLLRWPFSAHVEAMRDDACAGLQLLEGRHQLDVERRQQIQRDDGCRAQVRLEQVLVEKLDLVADAGLGQVGVRFLDAVGVDVDANGGRAKFLCCRDGDRPSPEPRS